MKNFHFQVFLSLFFCFLHSAFAQYEVVEFDYQNAYFNNGQPLPAETKLIFSGIIQPEIERVEMRLFKAGSNQEKTPLYQNTWRRESSDSGEKFRVPFSFQLHGGTDYDFIINYYRKISAEEREALRAALFETLNAYIDYSASPKNDQLKIVKTPQVMISDMNEIVRQGLSDYFAADEAPFSGFSDIIKNAIGSAKKSNHPALDSLSSLKTLIYSEAQQALNRADVVRSYTRKVLAYGTATGRRALALNIGYGGVFIDGGTQNASYDTSPYVGISFPLANRAYAGRFWSNTSISLGVFTQDFQNADSVKISGPIFGRPYYVGLGYNIFRFFKINAGAAITEKKGSSSIGGGNASIDVDGISIRPFVGLSAEIDLWLGFRERR